MKILPTRWLLASVCCFAQLPSAYAVDTGPVTNPRAETPVADSLATARAAIQRKNWNSAIRELEVLVRREPNNADAHNLLAYSLRNIGEYKRAQEHYEQALKLNPNHLGAHEYYGELYLKLHQPDNARKHLATLERLCGKNCEEYKDLAEAIAKYKPVAK